MNGTLDLCQRAGLLWLAQLRRPQETGKPRLLDHRASRRRIIISVLIERHIDIFFGRKTRFLTFIKLDFAIDAVQIASTDESMLPDPILQERA